MLKKLYSLWCWSITVKVAKSQTVLSFSSHLHKNKETNLQNIYCEEKKCGHFLKMGKKIPFYILAPFIKQCNAEIYVCPRLGEVWSVCNQSRKPDNSHLNISMTSLVEHSDTQPTECRFCLKFWCFQSNVCLVGLGLTSISMS